MSIDHEIMQDKFHKPSSDDERHGRKKARL
jgi:hypothetical protein